MRKIAVALVMGMLALPVASMAQHPSGPGQDHRAHQSSRPGQPSSHNKSQARPQQKVAPIPARNGPKRIVTSSKKYYPDRDYRTGPHYKPFKVSRNTRIYRGSNGRYYCRRNDGTTGLIAGVAIGGLLGNALGDGDSALLSTILGAGIGGALGREIDRGNVYCK